MVRQLAKQGGMVVFTSRNRKAGKDVEQEINSGLTLGNKVEAMQMDLADLRTEKSFVDDFKKKYQSLHVQINNAGVMNLPKPSLTKDNFEVQFGINHVGHFVLVNLLLDLLEASQPSRIICVSSCLHFDAVGQATYIMITSTSRSGHTMAGHHTDNRSWPTCSMRGSLRGGLRERE